MHLIDAVLFVFPITCGIMYATTYYVNSMDRRLPAGDRSLLAQIIGFAFCQFMFGYISGLVMMHVRVQTIRAGGETKEASTTTYKNHQYSAISEVSC